MSTLPISAITIGERARKDMGDIDALAASIAEHGLLHAIVIKPDGTLVAGERRLRACQQLGWAEVPVRTVDVADLLSAERAENEVRKDFTPSEAVAIAALIDDELKEQKRARRAEHNRRVVRIREARRRGEPTTHETLISGETQSAVTAAAMVGMSSPTYYRARAVVEAAEQEPQKYGDLVDAMDRTGKVSGAHTELLRRQGAEPAKPPAEKPKKPLARHVALRKLHYLKPNREVERALIALDGICHVLDHVAVEQLDSSRLDQWAAELKQHAAAIGRFTRRLRNVGQQEGNSAQQNEVIEVHDGSGVGFECRPGTAA